MQNIVSITSQGQLTIPKSMRDLFGIKGSVKAVLRKMGDTIVVTPKKDFWALEGSLQSKIRLSDSDLGKARKEFSKKWGKKND